MSMSTLRKVAAKIGLAAMLANTAAVAANNANNIQQKEIVTSKETEKKVAPKKISNDNKNDYKYNRTPKNNQRQYRKWLRQNPHLRASKKNKLK